MDKIILFIITSAVLAAGCTEIEGLPTGEDKKVEGSGLQIQEFTASDNDILPGQKTIVRLNVKNFNRQGVDIEDVQLYNYGILEIDRERNCSPEPQNLNSARKDFAPEMECSWTLKAPDESEIRGFESKRIPLKLNLEYNSTLRNNKQPYKLEFKNLSDISETGTKKVSYSNTEISLTVSGDVPMPEDGRPMDFKLANIGKGDVREQQTKDNEAFHYNITNFTGANFSDCDDTKETIVDEEVEFSCRVSQFEGLGSSTANLFFTTSYKYVKAPSLDIEVVKP